MQPLALQPAADAGPQQWAALAGAQAGALAALAGEAAEPVGVHALVGWRGWWGLRVARSLMLSTRSHTNGQADRVFGGSP